MKFEIFQDKKGEWRYRLRASNGRSVACSGEGYKTRQKVQATIRSIKKSVAEAEVEYQK